MQYSVLTPANEKLETTLRILVMLLIGILPFSIAAANTLSGIILIVLVAKIIRTRDLSVIRLPETRPMIALVLVGALALIFGIDTREGITAFISPLLKYATIFLAVCDSMKTTRDYTKLVAAILIGGIVSSAYGIYQYFVLSVGRISTFLYNPNLAGSYLATYTLVSLSMLLATKRKAHCVALAVSTILGLTATILTMSRGAILGLGCAIITLLFVMAIKSKKSNRVLAGIVVALVLAAIFMPDQVIDRFKSAVNLEDSSNRQRILMAQSGLKMFAERPLLGWGPGSFKILYEKYRPAGAIHFTTPHNIYILTMVELGSLGLASFLWLALALVRLSLQAIDRHPQDSRWVIAVAALLSTIAQAVHGLVDAALIATQLGLIICAIGGATASLGRYSVNTNAKKEVLQQILD